MAQVRTYYVTEGNTVRVSAQPLPDRQQREKEKREEQRRQKRKRQRMQQRMMQRQRLQAINAAAVVFCVCGLFVGYIKLTNNITTHMEKISRLQEEITAVKAENSAAESRIATAANLSDIKNIAIHQMGMVYAGKDQIVYYDMEAADYMNQYQSIP